MRPKKVVYLIEANEDQWGMLSFVLRAHAYRVVANTEEYYPDLILIGWPSLAGEKSVELKKAYPTVPMLLVCDQKTTMGEAQTCFADSILIGAKPTELLERVKILSARKRGPRKAAVRAASAPQPAMAV